MIHAGSVVTLDVVKPAVGGRMLARHDGQVVLVWGTIPGERVRARVERVGKGVVYAEAVDVVTVSPDRRAAAADWRCGGNVLAHVAYPRQLRLKAEILADAFARIGRMSVVAPDVMASPEHGYRMRARLHVRDQRIGFFREGSHDLCDAAATGQLLPDTLAWIAAAEQVIREERLRGVAWLEVAENVAADQRACHFELSEGETSVRYGALSVLAGHEVSDTVHGRPDDPASALRLRRHVRAFFQGNRYLLEPLAQFVVSRIPPGPVIDLYAGVGLFGLSALAAGIERATLVEGDPVSGADLTRNAEPFGDRASVIKQSVESFLASSRIGEALGSTRATVVVDPPRTGLSKDAVDGLVRLLPRRLIYVSCDPATLARDVRALVGGGYAVESLTGIDLFPNTAHVEAIAVLSLDTTTPPTHPHA